MATGKERRCFFFFRQKKTLREKGRFVCTPMAMTTVLHSKKFSVVKTCFEQNHSLLGHQRRNKGVSPSRLNEDVVVLRLPLLVASIDRCWVFSLLSKRRDYVAFGASLTGARNFSIKCSVSTLETNKFKLVLPFQHVMANSDRKALSFWTSSSRGKQTKEP